ncbi:pentapeptide repeat-containing protein [Anthocerotibacter panamensis]|uniref:pentapeptide repeat-containing protein n=1 Tax=Anthocerotibacter panamensis TaxID=2857077 RepID=UPI001C401BC6|nr:pentapeptide repeat-containing protein [Anthocerotibacter panamensis]
MRLSAVKLSVTILTLLSLNGCATTLLVYGQICVGCNLRGANLARTYIPNLNASQADLSKADLDVIIWPGANLEGAILEGAAGKTPSLERANLKGTNLKNTYLGGAVLYEVDLRGAYMWKTYLGGASLQCANLLGTNLENADLRGAEYDDNTRFPPGFDPVKAGTIKHKLSWLTDKTCSKRWDKRF